MPLPATLPPALFVTGTDTEIGKTAASTALLHALRRRGLRAVGMKPVASGSEDLGQGLRNEDALALQAASWPVPDYADLNPYALRQPLAPELAAAEDGVQVELAPIMAAFERLRAQADVVVVEGLAVGWHRSRPRSTSSTWCAHCGCRCCWWWACGWAASTTRV